MTDSISGGVNLTANSNAIGGDVTGRDKLVQITTNNYYGGAEGLSRELMRAPSPQPLRVLAVIASPVAGRTEADPAPGHLSGRAEWARLREAARVAPMLLARLRPPTAAELRTALSPNRAGAFNIVHFICHGTPGALALEDERGLTCVVPAAEIARDVRDGQIDLVVVNACYSAAGDAQSIAQALVAAGVRSVVAHLWPLIDRAAVVFSQVLYRELAAGRALRTAFDEAVRITTDQFDAERGNAVLLGDEALTCPRPSGPVQPSQVIENAALPDETARFFGRRAELLHLADLFANDHLRGAALTGIGGIGKSALAFEAADRHAWRFSGGVAYVRASEFGFSLDAALIDLARSLGVDVSGNPTRNLLAYLTATPCLLVLDNLERAERELPRLAEVINALNFDGGSKVLLTLRPPLSDRFHDLREINLRTGLDEASALDYVRFLAYQLNAPARWQDIDTARTLTRRVDGQPEIIRHFVHRSRTVPFNQVQREFTRMSGRDPSEMLQDIIGWQVLEAGAAAQTALSYLTIFPQTAVICEAAQAACGDADGLENLVKIGVIGLVSEPIERYEWHSTVMDWAKGQPAAANLSEAKQRAIETYAEWGGAHGSDYDVLQAEHDNLIAALEWGWAGGMWAEVSLLVQRIDDYLQLRGYWTVTRSWLLRGIEATGKLDVSNDQQNRLQNLLHRLGTLQTNQGELDSALTAFGQSAEISKQLGNEGNYAATLHAMAGIAVTRGDLDGALDLYRQSLDAWERLGDAKGKAATLHQMAGIAVTRGDLDGALDLYRQSLDASERLGDAQGKAATLGQMSNIFMQQNRWEEARQVLTEAIEIEKKIGDATIGYEIAKLGQIAEHDMDWPEAARLYAESVGYFEKLGSPVAGQVKRMLAAVLQRMAAPNG